MTQPTLQDVAAKAGVHLATASRALNPATRGMVSARTLRKVQAAAAALNYHGNSAARMLRTRRSQEIGVLVPDILNPLYASIARGAGSVLGDAGYAALILNTDNDASKAERAIRSVLERQVDGLVLAHAFLDDPGVIAVVEQGVPVILVLREVAGLQVPVVTVDDRRGTSLAVQHLVDLGHTRIAHVAGPITISTGRDRLAAFTSALAEQRLPPRVDDVFACESYTVAAGEVAAEWLTARSDPPTAVLAGNDLLALGLISGVERHGWSCPGDLSVVGYNDMPLADRFNPPLTTVRMPPQDLGAEAARMLVRQLEQGDRQVRRVELLPELVVRGSTAPPTGRHDPSPAVG